MIVEQDNTLPNLDQLAPMIYRSYPLDRFNADKLITSPSTLPEEKRRLKIMKVNEKYHKEVDLNTLVEAM